MFKRLTGQKRNISGKQPKLCCGPDRRPTGHFYPINVIFFVSNYLRLASQRLFHKENDYLTPVKCKYLKKKKARRNCHFPRCGTPVREFFMMQYYTYDALVVYVHVRTSRLIRTNTDHGPTLVVIKDEFVHVGRHIDHRFDYSFSKYLN